MAEPIGVERSTGLALIPMGTYSRQTAKYPAATSISVFDRLESLLFRCLLASSSAVVSSPGCTMAPSSSSYGMPRTRR